jgi:hypothetical protein
MPLGRRHFIQCVFFLGLALSLAGCVNVARQPGAEGTALSNLAVLEFENDPDGSSIVEVDGVIPKLAVSHRYEMNPGHHTVKAQVNFGYAVVLISVSFDLAAGEQYRLDPAITSRYVGPTALNQPREAIAQMLVVNERTGEQVPRETKLLDMKAVVPR